MLHALISAAGGAGLVALSLSVEHDDHAQHLHEQVGFALVGTAGGP